jgi:23S rRNA (adenine2503-C2)-methyltransferase
LKAVFDMSTEHEKKSILDFSREQLSVWLTDSGVAGYRADQIFKWIYLRQADDFDVMTDITKGFRERLSQEFTIDRLKVNQVETSRDGTRKYLFELADKNLIESVLIPEKDHYTLCISSQVGCVQDCQFCLTAKGGLARNLTTGEIISQVRDIRNGLTDPKALSNIVFMGMGEPLANYKNLVNAISVITDNHTGLRFANRRVTVSTAGLVSKLAALGRDTNVNLAVSLNATENHTRNVLMPINRKYPIEKLLEACRDYPLPPGRRITIEYILIKDVNDSRQDAVRLAKLLRPMRAKINLIPLNPHEGSHYRRSEDHVIKNFQDFLIGKNYTVMIRQSKGQDISAACGQLRAGS